MTEQTALSQRIQNSRIFIFVGYALFLLYYYSAWVDQGYGRQDIAILLVKVLPLLIFLPWLIKRSGKALVFLGVVLLVYALKAIADLIESPYQLLNLFQISSLLLLFTSIILYLRWSNELRKLVNPPK